VATRKARVCAHAKINLSLKVLHKRPDGYHEIRTVFQTVGIHDVIEVEFRPSKTTEIAIEGMDIPDNLIARAALLVMDETGVTGRVRFRVEKNIPMGGGLGGGSSDAAAVLLALPALAGRRIPLPALMRMGAGLGSDVPFFLAGGTALGLGRGEELYPLPDAPAWPLLIVAPRLHVSTPEAYRALGRELTSLADVSKLDVLQSFVWGGPLSALENDFEEAVFRMHPQLEVWKRRLVELGAPAAHLSGSGAALFGVFPDRAVLERALPRFPAEQLQVLPTRMLTRARYRAGWVRSLAEHLDGSHWPPQSRYGK
jgi:4-diphosphocytidyl-2-C-methyl-D-erythritol kinase